MKPCPSRPSRSAAFPLALALPLLLGGCGWFGGNPKVGARPPASATAPQTGAETPSKTSSAKQAGKKSGRTPERAGTVFNKGVAELNAHKFKDAAKTFNAVEVNYPYSIWASHAQLLQGYADYKRDDFTAAVGALGRFIELHPANPDIAYAYYLKALCYYEQIEDVDRDQTFTREAASALRDVITRFPATPYARDARIKLHLAENRLAGHRMVIGRFYERQNLYAAAAHEYRIVIGQYQTTTFAPEALERLTECYLDLGLTHEARRTAAVLGYNYPGSTWYREAYGKLENHGLISNSTPQPKQAGGWLFGLL